MPGRLGPRLALEAAFLILLAVGAGLADLSPTAIVLVMVAAWVIVAVIEFTAERIGSAFPPLRRTYASPPVRRPFDDELVEATVVTPVAPPPPVEESGARDDPVPAESEEPAAPPPAPAVEAKAAPEPEPADEAPSRRRFWQRREREEA